MLILTTFTNRIRSIFPSFPAITTQPFSTNTRRTVLIDRLMSVPSFVSITRRGPASGSVASEGAGSGLVLREAIVPRLVFGAGRVFVGSGLSATVSSFFGASVVVVSVS
jgi:hypothetical protein